MTCPHCGKYNTSSGKECEYCGKPLKVVSNKKVVPIKNTARQDLGQHNRTSVTTTEIAMNTSRTSRIGVGIISAIALAFIGLFVGLLVFDNDESKRNSFVVGWIVGVLILVVAIVIGWSAIVV